MNIIENIRERNKGIVTAAIYISCNKSINAENFISEQLNLIHKFVDTHDIIIVDSYIDRDSIDSYNRMLFDAQNKYFDIILVCGSTAPTLATDSIVTVDVLE